MPQWLLFTVIGLLGGVASGLFGIGGGVVIVPALIYWAGFSQHRATGTSLAVLLPPIGLAAVLEYYRHGNVDIKAAMFLAATMFIGAWGGAFIANQMKGPHVPRKPTNSVILTVERNIRISGSVFQPPPNVISGGIYQKCITGVINQAERLLVLLDLERLFSHGGKALLIMG